MEEAAIISKCQHFFCFLVFVFFVFCFLVFVFFFLLFRATPTACRGLGIESELWLLTYTTATEMQDLSHVCDLQQSSKQYQIPDPLSKARGQTHFLMNTSWICFHCASLGTPMPTLLEGFLGGL